MQGPVVRHKLLERLSEHTHVALCLGCEPPCSDGRTRGARVMLGIIIGEQEADILVTGSLGLAYPQTGEAMKRAVQLASASGKCAVRLQMS